MVSIIACCANGSGTSVMMNMTLNKVIKKQGYAVSNTRHCSIADGKKNASDYDIILCPKDFIDEFADAANGGSKVIGLHNVMSERELTEKLEGCGLDLK